MLPPAYELPAAIAMILGGAIACFAGYRLFRVVLAIYGFILGAMLASSIVGVSNTVGMVVAALAGGVVGAIVLMFAYFVGIALIGAGLGVLITHVVWGQIATPDPPAALIILMSICGAVGAMLLQRYVIIVGTAFGGAWTVVLGASSVIGSRSGARLATTPEVWILYPLSPGPGQRWLLIAWVALGLIGTGLQLAVTAKRKG
jgi:hypothetical protein